MAQEREHILQAAQNFVTAQQFDRALLEYGKLIQQDPNDARVLLKTGDLYAQTGNFPGAIATYDKVAELYVAQGFAPKAVAVYRQVWELVKAQPPETPEKEQNFAHVIERLLQLYGQLGLLNDALGMLDEEATRLRNAHREDAAIDIFRRMVTVAGDIPLSHLRLAEGLCRTNQVDDAMLSFEKAANLLYASSRPDDSLRVIERMLHFKQEPKYAKLAAKIYLQKGTEAEGMQALSRLQICFQANSKDIETLELLGQAFDTIGQGEKALEVRKELARQAHEQGRPELFHATLASLQGQLPNDEQVRALTELPPPPASDAEPAQDPGNAAQGGPPPLPANAFAPPKDEPLPADLSASAEDRASTNVSAAEALDAIISSPPAAPPPAVAKAPPPAATKAPPPPKRTPPPPPVPPVVEELDDLEVLEDSSLDAISPSVPQPPIADQKPAEIDVQAHTRAALVDAKTFAGLKLYDRAIERIQVALEFDPRSIELRELLRDIYAESGDRDGAIEEMLTTAAIYIEYDHPHHARTVLLNVLEAEPNHALARRTLAQLGEPETVELSPAALKSNPLPQFDAPVPVPAVPQPSVEETLEKFDNLSGLGNLAGARQALIDQLVHSPDHPLLLEALTELDDADRTDNDDAVFDLRHSLHVLERAVRESQHPPAPGAQPDSGPLNVDKVFQTFKAKVRSQISENDSSTHYDLGVAYKEMGLLEDAVSEFELAARDTKRACTCYAVVGNILAEQQKWSAAVAAYEKGLGAGEQSPAQSLALNYDLGVAYEELEDAGRATEQFQMVLDSNPTYRDASDRLNRLRGSQAPGSGSRAADEELDRAFQELLGGD